MGNPDEPERGWERARDAQARVVAAVKSILSRVDTPSPVALVGHGGVGTLLLCHLLGEPISTSSRFRGRELLRLRAPLVEARPPVVADRPESSCNTVTDLSQFRADFRARGAARILLMFVDCEDQSVLRKTTMPRNTNQVATVLLKTQHRKVEAIFKKLEGGRAEAEPLLAELTRDLAAHMRIEQDIFYPAVRQIDEDLILEAFEEHSLAEIALKRLLATPPGDPTFIAKVTTLKELILHHVKEEEEELFPKVEKKLPKERNDELGQQMKAMFDELTGDGAKTSLSKGSRTSADVAERRVLKEMASEAE